MKLNKLLAMSAVVACGLTLASCGGTKEVTVGIGYNGSFGESYGNMQLDLTAAMVSFEADGTIVDARLDVVQVKVGLNEEGTGLSLKNTNANEYGKVPTKLELGKNYNMQASSAIGKEVDAQIEAFADWCVGKKYNEIAGQLIPGSGHGIAVHEELASSVTITVDAFVAAIESAWENRSASTYKVSKDSKAGLSMEAGLAYNYGNPTWEISVDVAGVMAKDGVVEAAAIDAIVYPTTVVEGALTSDTTSKYFQNGELTSKKTLGDKYAMAPASPIGAEWDAQALTIETAAVGKTGEQITALKAGEGELATATMTLTSYLAALAEAATYAGLEHIGPQA